MTHYGLSSRKRPSSIRDHLGLTFWVVAFIWYKKMLQKDVLAFKSVDETQCVAIQMKAIEQYFHVVLLILLYKVVLTSKSGEGAPVCDHSHESY